MYIHSYKKTHENLITKIKIILKPTNSHTKTKTNNTQVAGKKQKQRNKEV